ncbi:MAG: hypothetical protein GY774_13595 [Planctomycetes bacterium]|nr:hypothetical protein [Planctomycetota bacterium]
MSTCKKDMSMREVAFVGLTHTKFVIQEEQASNVQTSKNQEFKQSSIKYSGFLHGFGESIQDGRKFSVSLRKYCYESMANDSKVRNASQSITRTS